MRLLFLIIILFSVVPAQSSIDKGISLLKAGQILQANSIFYNASLTGSAESKYKSKYYLGMSYKYLGLKQLAIFQFIQVIKNGNSLWVKKSLTELADLSDSIGDEGSFNYAISKIRISDIPQDKKSRITYRIGRLLVDTRQFKKGADTLSTIPKGDPLYAKARYHMGQAYAELDKTRTALSSFNNAANARSQDGYSDTQRVAALLGRARVFYQMKEWDKAVIAYRMVPKDSPLWKEIFMESAWAMLRSGKFRSAISNFQTLHSDYFSDNFLPESYLLRSIVYLYICKYDELEKVLQQYEGIYSNGLKQLTKYLRTHKNPIDDYKIIVPQVGRKNLSQKQIPRFITKEIHESANFKNIHKYLNEISNENKKVSSYPTSWKRSPVGIYSKRLMENRISKTKKKTAQILRSNLYDLQKKLVEFEDQKEFLRFEVINAEKERIKQEIAQENSTSEKTINKDRDYYVKNGYEYWPFKGEYWLDELGNYHYVGQASCSGKNSAAINKIMNVVKR